MRFGLVGTGWWARTIHGRALAASDEVELVGVWGRDSGRAAAAASELGTVPVEDLESLLERVDALSFAVPPDVQADIALRAARAGKHLLLEKPVATAPAVADELAAVVADGGLSTVVFFTRRFVPEMRRWIAESSQTAWSGGFGHFLGSAFAPGSHFDTPWRHEKGGLWDIGPHALSVILPVLGPVVEVRAAAAGAGDLVHLALAHESGATSTVSLTIEAPEAATHSELELWGPTGRTSMPAMVDAAPRAAVVALHELVELAAAGQSHHPCDVAFGAEVVRLLAEAEQSLAAQTRWERSQMSTPPSSA